MYTGFAVHGKRSVPGPAAKTIIEFAASPDGRALIAGSSEAWAQAAIAAGTDPTAAHAAARRTTAFYTGESAEPD